MSGLTLQVLRFQISSQLQDVWAQIQPFFGSTYVHMYRQEVMTRCPALFMALVQSHRSGKAVKQSIVGVL